MTIRRPIRCVCLGCCLLILGSSSQDVPPAPAPRLIYLDRSTLSEEANSVDLARQGLLTQELVRQAFLITVREELGLTARDARLGDTPPANAADALFAIGAKKHNVRYLEIRRGPAGEDAARAQCPLSAEPRRGNYRALSAELAQLSGSGLVQMLKAVGVSTKPIRHADGEVPAEVSQQLSKMCFIAQFSAVRQLHHLAHENGSSDAMVAALVRAYSNLGLLTEVCWHPAHKVFKARALLYAQRLCAQRPKDPWACWHRAYAMLAVGLPNEARSDLKSAEQLWGNLPESSRPPRPGWVELLAAHCHYQLEKIAPDKVPEEDKPLAHFLRYLTIEQAGSNEWVTKSAKETLKSIPDCYRVHDMRCLIGGVRLGHAASLQGLRAFGQYSYQTLRDVPDLPESARAIVQKQLALQTDPQTVSREASKVGDTDDEWDLGDEKSEFEVRRSLMEALLAAEPPQAAPGGVGQQLPADVGRVDAPAHSGEPSWATLGLLIREISFLQVWRRLCYVMNSSEKHYGQVTRDSVLRDCAPLIAQHPYLPYLEYYAEDPQKRQQALQQLKAKPPVDLDMQSINYISPLRMDTPPSDQPLWDDAAAHWDQSTRERILTIRLLDHMLEPKQARMLLGTDSLSPFARSILLSQDPSTTEKTTRAWEKEGVAFPGVLLSCGTRYLWLQRFEDAERCFRRSLEICPQWDAFRGLSYVYMSQRKVEPMLATLHQVLDNEEYWRDHQCALITAVECLRQLGEWRRAIPYAEAVAPPQMGRMSNYAGMCHEALANWSKAEEYYRAFSEWYSGNRRPDWYFFCRRTGKGDVEAARQRAAKCLEEIPDKDPYMYYHYDPFAIGMFHLMEKRYSESLRLFQEQFEKDGNPAAGLQIAVLADQIGKQPLRDEVLQKIPLQGANYRAEDTQEPRTALIGLAGLIVDDLAKAGKDSSFLEKADALCPTRESLDRIDYLYYLGKHLSLHGREEAAVKYWKKSLATCYMMYHGRTLAGFELVSRGYPPDCHFAER